MITRLSALNVTTNGYGVVADLEAQKDPYGVEEYIRKSKKECEEKARQYLAEHPKTTYYVASGYPTIMADEIYTPDPDYSAVIPYTEEEIKRIKQLIVQEWNNADPDSPIQSIDDINNFHLGEWEGANDELDELVWKRAEEYNFVVTDLDMDHPVHAYMFHSWEFSKREDKMIEYRSGHHVVLADEEYLYLLTEQLFDRTFSFNRLLRYNAPLAQKISNATAGNAIIDHMGPYVIIMTEVVKDMEAIDGHDPVHDDLYDVSDDVHSYHSHVIIDHDKIKVYWEDLPCDDFSQERMTSDRVEGIDAKAVLKLFEAKDYYELLDRIKERFHEATAYDDFLTYLEENGVTTR